MPVSSDKLEPSAVLSNNFNSEDKSGLSLTTRPMVLASAGSAA